MRFILVVPKSIIFFTLLWLCKCRGSFKLVIYSWQCFLYTSLLEAVTAQYSNSSGKLTSIWLPTPIYQIYSFFLENFLLERALVLRFLYHIFPLCWRHPFLTPTSWSFLGLFSAASWERIQGGEHLEFLHVHWCPLFHIWMSAWLGLQLNPRLKITSQQNWKVSPESFLSSRFNATDSPNLLHSPFF